jgi:hypothetical protein
MFYIEIGCCRKETNERILLFNMYRSVINVMHYCLRECTNNNIILDVNNTSWSINIVK